MGRSTLHLPRDTTLAGSEVVLDDAELRRVLGLVAGDELRRRSLDLRPGRAAVTLVATGERLAAVSVGQLGCEPVVAWFPDDPGLPGLADGWRALAAALRVDPLAPVRPLAWVPHRRMVLAVGDVVVKLHAGPGETERAVVCAALAATVLEVPEVLGIDPARAVHVQRRIAGRALQRADARATIGPAAQLLRRLQGAAAVGLDGSSPSDLVDACRPVVDLVAFAAPELSVRARWLLSALVATLPAGFTDVASHGDFNVGQLLQGADGALVLVDTDTMCRAPVAFDVASYAANLVSGRQGDLGEASHVAARLAGALEDPPHVDWYLAAMVVRRLDRALRRCKRDWPERTARLVAAAEQLVGGL